MPLIDVTICYDLFSFKILNPVFLQPKQFYVRDISLSWTPGNVFKNTKGPHKSETNGNPTRNVISAYFSRNISVEQAGGKCLPCVVDVRDESQVIAAVNKAVSTFGGIDIVVNNASAISLTGTLDTDIKRYDLMHNVNTRGTFLV